MRTAKAVPEPNRKISLTVATNHDINLRNVATEIRKRGSIVSTSHIIHFVLSQINWKDLERGLVRELGAERK